ncbi:hypothetical protein [Erwinia sorbitola]|uniref:Uncharacterized protein n=1 Tax=Erwinia sorbitola TaxID=2681984 RepID=A0ABW9RDA4_9GAMM|nr:hypothetical protein [Erwinia sorbitola]MTD28153.1 hypothetical protein [Erwinia sorbitola]
MQISVIDDDHRHRWYHRRRYSHRAMLKFLQDTVEPAIRNLSQDDDISASYPWCFVFSAKELNRKKHYVGALTLYNNKSLCVIYSHLTYDKVSEDFKKNFHIAFWLARILVLWLSKSKEDKNTSFISEWINSLKIHYSPFLESILIRKEYRFRNTSESLLSNYHCLDNQISVDGGVEFMPWTNWPECIQSGSFVWIWRQSRHGRIIDSRKIPIPMDITNVHR